MWSGTPLIHRVIHIFCGSEVTPISDPLEPEFCLFILTKTFFVRPEFPGVNDPPAIMNPREMLHMKHLVEEDIRRHIQRNRRHIENAANKDRIVGRIVTPENVAGFRRRPGQAWLNQRCVEVLPVQPFKQKFKVDVPAARSFSTRPPASVYARNPCAFLNLFRQYKSSVDPVVRIIDSLPVEL